MKAAPLILLSLLLACPLVGWPWMSYRAARLRADTATRLLATTASMADEVIRLRAQRPAASVGKRPEPGVYGQVADALVEAGLPTDALVSLTPDADSTIGTDEDGATYKRQTLRLTLERLTLPQTGRFLAAWKKCQPEWTIASLQLTPMSGKEPRAKEEPRAEAAGALKPLRIALTMEATYLDASHTGSPTP